MIIKIIFFDNISIMLITLQQYTYVMENVITIRRRENEKIFSLKLKNHDGYRRLRMLEMSRLSGKPLNAREH